MQLRQRPREEREAAYRVRGPQNRSVVCLEGETAFLNGLANHAHHRIPCGLDCDWRAADTVQLPDLFGYPECSEDRMAPMWIAPAVPAG